MSLFARMVAGMAAGDTDALFIAQSHAGVAAGSATLSFTGALAGDLGIIISCDAVTSPPAGWSLAGSVVSWGGNTTAVFRKVLAASDISTGSITLSGTNGGIVYFAAYRNATSATTAPGTSTASATSLAVAGYTRSSQAKAVLAYAFVGSTGTLTPPPSTTSRISSFSTTAFISGLVDIIPAQTYLDGTVLNWSWVGAGGAQGQIIEVT